MTNEQRTVVVLGVDTPIGLTVVRELGRHGLRVHGIGRSEHSLARPSRYMTSFSVRPKGKLGDWLPATLAQLNAAALFAISEQDLIDLAAFGGHIGSCRLLTPKAEALRLVLDKNETLRIAASLGLDTPRNYTPEPGEPLPAFVQRVSYPVVLKWANPPAVVRQLSRHGLPLLKTEYCKDAASLLNSLKRYEPIGEFPLVQEYCAGRGLGQMLHMHGGEATLRFQHERVNEWPPEGGVSTLCRSVPLTEHSAQMEKSIALLRAIGWEGPAMVEYRHDPSTRRYVLMEVNGRFWGSLPLAYHCGAHFAWEQYQRSVLGAAFNGTPPGYRQRTACFMIPETRRLVRILLQPGAIADPFFKRRPLADLLRYVTGFIDPRRRYYVFSLPDPAPFLQDMLNVARSALRKEN